MDLKTIESKLAEIKRLELDKHKAELGAYGYSENVGDNLMNLTHYAGVLLGLQIAKKVYGETNDFVGDIIGNEKYYKDTAEEFIEDNFL